MWYQNIGITFFYFVPKYAYDGQTDGQMDIITKAALA